MWRFRYPICIRTNGNCAEKAMHSVSPYRERIDDVCFFLWDSIDYKGLTQLCLLQYFKSLITALLDIWMRQPSVSLMQLCDVAACTDCYLWSLWDNEALAETLDYQTCFLASRVRGTSLPYAVPVTWSVLSLLPELPMVFTGAFKTVINVERVFTSSFLIILKRALNVSFALHLMTQNQRFLCVIKEVLWFCQVIKSKWGGHHWNSHKSLRGSRKLHRVSGARAAWGNDRVFP